MRLGAPAPWSVLAPASRSGFTLRAVESRLRVAKRDVASPAPCDRADVLRATVDDSNASSRGRSAVLVALFEDEGECRVILTRRALTLRAHGGEIAFPGGRSEGDETPTATALREAREEIALDPTLVTPIAWLTPLSTYSSAMSIWPVVATLAQRPALRADPVEVDRVFSVALRDLVADDAFVEERWRAPALHRDADDDGYASLYFFRVPGDVIWGATARVLTELLCHVTGVPWPGEGGQPSTAP